MASFPTGAALFAAVGAVFWVVILADAQSSERKAGQVRSSTGTQRVGGLPTAVPRGARDNSNASDAANVRASSAGTTVALPMASFATSHSNASVRIANDSVNVSTTAAPSAVTLPNSSGGMASDNIGVDTMADDNSSGGNALQAGAGYRSVIDFLPVNIIRSLVVEKTPGLFPPPCTHTLPALVSRFDLLYGLDDGLEGWNLTSRQSVDDPQTVFASGLAVKRLLEQAERSSWPTRSDRVVVFGNTETPISEAFGDTPRERDATVAALQKYFGRIWYYVTDVEVYGVGTSPLGFTEMYMRSRTEELEEAYFAAKVSDSYKTGQVLAAWGKYTAHNGPHLAPPSGPVKPGGDTAGWISIYNAAMDNRHSALDWVESEAAQGIGVDERAIPTVDWWRELSKYRFLLSPIGTAIQCSRLPEALLMLTVPIIKRGGYKTHDDLLALSFPIVVVEEWEDITSDSLSTWWSRLAPQLEGFRRNCLTTAGYWRIFTQGSC